MPPSMSVGALEDLAAGVDPEGHVELGPGLAVERGRLLDPQQGPLGAAAQLDRPRSPWP